ncbi:hypothetical protein AB6A40_000186 [Gnathostoma spinigerum]|uniref:Beta-catenin n=1 Tax=Gnathostoma spinigerum TaxID=75299 RepID=A0ABD6EAH7_9BILA
MNNSPLEYGRHTSPVDSLRTALTPDGRTSGPAVSSKVGPYPSVPPPHMSSTSNKISPSSISSGPMSQTHLRTSQIPLQYTNVPPTGMTGTIGLPSTQPGANSSAMFRVQMWSNNYDSGVHSMTHSTAPSMLSMSSLRAGSQISTMSEDSHNRLELTDQQQMKFENIPSNLGRSSQDGETTRNAIPELIHLLSDSDEVVVQRAATMVQNIAKMDSEQPPFSEPLIRASEVVPALRELLKTRSNSPAIIKAALGALFQISERRDGLECILRVNEQTSGGLLIDIIQHIRFTGGSAIRYAVLTFHTILAEKSMDNRNLEIARANGALQAITSLLGRENNEKLLSILVECVRLLCDKNPTQKMMFLQLNGAAKLLHILRNLRYESLLWRTTNLLKIFSNADPQAIVRCGGYDVLHFQLEHASQRLVMSTLECIRNMSDVPCKDLDVSPLLTKLLQLLGAFDPVIVLYCTGILSNLLANNQRNKEFLFSSNAVNTLYRVLLNTCSTTASSPSQQQRLEDIQERALATLRHLCVGHSGQEEVQQAVLQTDYASEYLLQKLVEMRPSILKQTLHILQKAAGQDSNILVFRNTRLPSNMESTFAERLLIVLKVACEQLSSNEMVEEVRVAELIHLSLSTLQLICRDRHIFSHLAFLIQRQEYLYIDGEGSVLLPIFALHQGYVEDENLKRSALGLIAELSRHPEIAMAFSSDMQLMSALQHYTRSRNQAISTYAQQAYSRISHEPSGMLQYPGDLSPNHSRLSQSQMCTNSNSHSVCNLPYGEPQQQSTHLGYLPNYGSSNPPPSSCYGPPSTQTIIYSPHQPQSHVGRGSSFPSSVTSSGGVPQAAQVQVSNTPQLPHHPAVYGREGPSELSTPDNGPPQDMNVSSSDSSWPQDLSNLTISDDPFATMLCSQQYDSSTQRIPLQARQPYTSGSRTEDVGSCGMYCSPGPPNVDCDSQMEAMQLGSPELQVMWNDSSTSYTYSV